MSIAGFVLPAAAPGHCHPLTNAAAEAVPAIAADETRSSGAAVAAAVAENKEAILNKWVD